ncbi:MAG: DUF58 domain-containing protein [Draconibacterium sp.]
MKTNTQNIVPTLRELLNLEHLVASTAFSLLPKQPVHSVLAGKHASKLRGRGLDFDEVRKYVAGDDIRNIDWRVTARTRSTHTKVFTEEKEKPFFVVTDMTPRMFFGSKIYTKNFIAVQLAAISAFKVLKNSDRFGGLVFNNEECRTFSPQRSRKVVMQYLQKLVDESEAFLSENKLIQPKAELLDKALLRTVSMTTHDYVILIISDFRGISAESKKHLIQLSRHNDVVLARISDPLEEQLPNDKLVLSDGDLQILWEAKKKKAGEKYYNSAAESKSSFKNEMTKYGIPIIELNTVEDIQLQLKNLFKAKLNNGKS